MKNRLYTLISTAVILLLWGILAHIVDNPVKFPTPVDTFKALVAIVTHKFFFIRVLETVKRILISFGIAFVLAVMLGIVSGFVTPVYYFLKPIVLTQRAVPTMAVIMLALIWIGRELTPLLVCILVVFPLIYSAVVTGIRQIDQKLLEMAQLFRLSKKKLIRHLYLPSIKSSLISVSSAAMSLNIKVAIAAEVLSQPKYAIGTSFQVEKSALNTAGLMAWALVAVVIAAILEWVIEHGIGRLKH